MFRLNIFDGVLRGVVCRVIHFVALAHHCGCFSHVGDSIVEGALNQRCRSELARELFIEPVLICE